MSQPLALVDETRPNHVCLLKKVLYGLKQHRVPDLINFLVLFLHLGLLSVYQIHRCLFIIQLRSRLMF